MAENLDFDNPQQSAETGKDRSVEDDNYASDSIPIFWGPKQPYEEGSYREPDYTKWRSAEVLKVPSVVRLIAEIDPEYDGRKLKKKNSPGTGRCGHGITWLYLGYRHIYDAFAGVVDNLAPSPCSVKFVREYFFLKTFAQLKDLHNPPYNYHKTTAQIISERTIIAEHSKLDFQNVNGQETAILTSSGTSSFLCTATGEMTNHSFPQLPTVGPINGTGPFLPPPISFFTTSDEAVAALEVATSNIYYWFGGKLTLFFFYPCIRLINDGSAVGLTIVGAFGDWYTDPTPFFPEPFE